MVTVFRNVHAFCIAFDENLDVLMYFASSSGAIIFHETAINEHYQTNDIALQAGLSTACIMLVPTTPVSRCSSEVLS